MKKLLLLCFLLASLGSSAQSRPGKMLVLNKDSIWHRFNSDKWKFSSGDDSAMALPAYDDSKWDEVLCPLWRHMYRKYEKDSIGWFRLHFIADSSICRKPLALRMTHFGASVLYFDGKKVETFGEIAGKKKAEFFDPGNTPAIIYIDTPGEHLIALHYQKNTGKLAQRFTDMDGFLLSLAGANNAIWSYGEQMQSLTFLMVLFFGIFIAISFIHMLLFLYYKAARSNFYFSLFCLALSLVFLLPYLIRVTNSPSLGFICRILMILNGSLACISLSGFNNELFSRRKRRFYVIATLSLLMPFIWYFDDEAGMVVCFSLIGLVALETVVLILRGIIKKVKGARIIGGGLLLFALFILFIFIYGYINGDIEINENDVFGQLVEIVMAIAVLCIPISMSAYLAWSFARINKDLKVQLDQVEQLSARTLEQEQEKKKILEGQKEKLELEVAQRTAEVVQQKEEIEKQHEELKEEKKKSDDLLLNILPEEVAEELKESGSSEAKFYDHVTVLFTDFVAFTKAGERLTPQELVSELHDCFKAFDEIISRYDIEKIKTIGDAYLAVSGLPVADANHAQKMLSAALDIRQFMLDRKAAIGEKTFEIRIGIHSGSVVAGIVGVKKFAYDIWGDTVNTAARMEQNSEAGKINISQTTYDMVKDKFNCIYRGQITAKNKGELKMYFVEGKMAL